MYSNPLEVLHSCCSGRGGVYENFIVRIRLGHLLHALERNTQRKVFKIKINKSLLFLLKFPILKNH